MPVLLLLKLQRILHDCTHHLVTKLLGDSKLYFRDCMLKKMYENVNTVVGFFMCMLKLSTQNNHIFQKETPDLNL